MFWYYRKHSLGALIGGLAMSIDLAKEKIEAAIESLPNSSGIEPNHTITDTGYKGKETAEIIGMYDGDLSCAEINEAISNCIDSLNNALELLSDEFIGQKIADKDDKCIHHIGCPYDDCQPLTDD
jgi:hypothetical protein